MAANVTTCVAKMQIVTTLIERIQIRQKKSRYTCHSFKPTGLPRQDSVDHNFNQTYSYSSLPLFKNHHKRHLPDNLCGTG